MQVEATQLHQLTNRELIDSYERKIKRWLASAVADVPSPQLVMIRVTLSDAVTISRFCAWLIDFYRKKQTKQPFKYLWVKEDRPSDADNYAGVHHHFALVTSASLTNNTVMPFVLAKERGLIVSWWASRDLQGKKWLPFEKQHALPLQIHYLRQQQGLDAALQHLAYLAKAETKHIASTQRSIGCSS